MASLILGGVLSSSEVPKPTCFMTFMAVFILINVFDVDVDVDVGVNLLLGCGGVELLKVRMARGGGHRLSGGENTSMLLKFKLLESFLGEAFWDKYGTRYLLSLPPKLELQKW